MSSFYELRPKQESSDTGDSDFDEEASKIRNMPLAVKSGPRRRRESISAELQSCSKVHMVKRIEKVSCSNLSIRVALIMHIVNPIQRHHQHIYLVRRRLEKH